MFGPQAKIFNYIISSVSDMRDDSLSMLGTQHGSQREPDNLRCSVLLNLPKLLRDELLVSLNLRHLRGWGKITHSQPDLRQVAIHLGMATSRLPRIELPVECY